MIVNFLVGSGVLFWLLLLPIGVIVGVAIVRGTRTLRAERAALDTAISQHAANGTNDLEQYLRNGGTQ